MSLDLHLLCSSKEVNISKLSYIIVSSFNICTIYNYIKCTFTLIIYYGIHCI